MSYFSVQQDKFEVFAIYENSITLCNEDKEMLDKLVIKLLEPIHPFSISSPIKTFTSIFHLRKVIKANGIDLVHILFATPHALWGNFISVPYIITTRGSDVLIAIPDLLMGKGVKAFYFRLLFHLFRRAFNRSASITATSNRQIAKIKELFSKDSALIRTGISVNEIKAINKSELLPSELLQQSYIFSPRFMSPVYNISLQIQSLVFLDELILQKYLFVFVRGKSFNIDYFTEQCHKLEQLKNEKGLKYIIIDFFDQEALWMAFKKASLTIMTPISDGTPNSALEAMAAECPLVIPHLDYDADIFGSATFVLEKNEPEQLASLIEKALTSYQKAMIDLASKRVIELGNRTTEMKRLEQVYFKII